MKPVEDSDACGGQVHPVSVMIDSKLMDTISVLWKKKW